MRLKPINDLLDKEFYIPAYQRGFRWTEKQVIALLDDIYEFEKQEKEKGEFYCLQPLVIKQKQENNQYEVIDGQQRLTTIYLILKSLNETLFSLEYETRTESKVFLEHIREKYQNEKDRNIDFFHISNAYQSINNWFDERKLNNENFKSNFKETLLNQVKVIWYEIEADEVEAFSRLNSGKIPLTNAELIKALFLNRSRIKQNDDNEQIIRLKQEQIAFDWDRVESELQNDDLWYFIKNTNSSNEYQTRIDYLFELFLNNIYKYKYIDKSDYGIFIAFNQYMEEKSKNEKKDILDIWIEIKQIFQTIKEWLIDKEFYHIISYLVATETTKLPEILSKFKGRTKSEFKECLKEDIKQSLKNITLEDLTYENNKDKNAIKKVLLLHSIQTMLNNENETVRFPIDQYKKESWDIEHIHAIATDVKIKKEELKDWLIQNYVKKNGNNEDEDLNNVINKIINSEESKEIESEQKRQEIIDYVLGEVDHSLGNLCLLDSSTNRSYKNASFKVKRSEIIKRDGEGTFIPICTRNAFMKYYYTEKVGSLDLWNDEDRKYYLKNIQNTIKRLY